MTPEQVDLIRKSFDAMWSMRGDIADLCYSRFFELAPHAVAFFADLASRFITGQVLLIDGGRSPGGSTA
jgi:hypothetical protein